VTEPNPTPTWAADIISSLRYPLEVQSLQAGQNYILPRPNGEYDRIDLTNTTARFNGGLEPIAKQGQASFCDAPGFIDYVNTHGKEKATEIYADLDTLNVIAVLNGHDRVADLPGFGNHRARLSLKETDEWKAWKEADRSWMTQEHFAHFLDGNRQDVSMPLSADLLEAVQNLTVHTSAVFQSKVKISQGFATFNYTEEQGPAQSMAIPEALSISIKPFYGAETQIIDASIRWKFQNDKDKKALYFRVLLNRPANIAREQFEKVCNLVQQETNLPVYFGTAPQPLA
jgi:uncharacterized protein YfdQ (DUF2303 family)